MSQSEPAPIVVCKFGGTSVSSLANWQNILSILGAATAAGELPVVVHSALSGVTDSLARLVDAALISAHPEVLAAIRARHVALCEEMQLEVPSGLLAHLDDLGKLADGIALVGEVSDGVRARAMATGELMATEIGAAFLNSQGVATTLLDARGLLTASATEAGGRVSVLSASCDFSFSPRLAEELRGWGTVVLTQGFIASDAAGHTVLLGRGGSDTSAAYLAARLGASRLEIWTDVPGMFSANPRDVRGARLLKNLHYDEAQEIATSGAKVLHPRCILPARAAGIPLLVRATQSPGSEGTRISNTSGAEGARLKAIALRRGITLISMDSPGMWHQVGFLADAFAVFKRHGMSVDLVSTSETNVTVTLDPQANSLAPSQLDALVAELSRLCRVEVLGPCASLSLLGRNIRAIIHRLGDAFELFEEHKIYLVSQAANDLNFTFVIDEAQATRLVGQLHDLLIPQSGDDPIMGPSWEDLQSTPQKVPVRAKWWRSCREQLLSLMEGRQSAYVYHLDTVRERAMQLMAMRSLDRVFYAIKANSHPEILRTVAASGLGLECVSRGEVEHVRRVLPDLPVDRLLFTPNFAGRDEYQWALREGLRLTLDNLQAMQAWAGLLAGHTVFVRIDTGQGHGHHQHVRTGGSHSKFGIPLDDLDGLVELARAHHIRIAGLHAHTGSGNFDLSNWLETAEILAAAAGRLGGVEVLDLGGGLGVPDRDGLPALDLAGLDAGLAAFRDKHPGFDLWMEPGRFLVAEAGVLLARVTQVKGKGQHRYVGVATGMNSLIRPALYGAYHDIYNLSRLDEPGVEAVTVVGPICETGDVLGRHRSMAPTVEGDILLIDTAGAYGRAMASHYNLREPAEECVI
ncbi:MAG: bifunctional aspartate kinase/diaminopimelate decarboxylase [Steroidobacteraceae bacterium]